MPHNHIQQSDVADDNRRTLPAANSSVPSGASRARRSKRLFHGLLVFTIALVSWRILPHQVASWYCAAYEHHTLEGDANAALAAIEKAIAWDEFNPEYWMNAGSAAMEVGDYPRSWQHFDHARELLQHHHSHATNAIASAQNGAAYARALANSELDRASEDIAAALRVLPKESAFIDTSGYIRYLQGDLKGALEETHSAVTQFESVYHAQRASALSLQKSIRRRKMNHRLRNLNEVMAELYLHRGLVYQELGKSEPAERDLAQAEYYQDKARKYAAGTRKTPAQPE